MPFPFNSRYQYKRTNVFVQTKEQNSSHRLDQGDFSTAAATISIWVFGEIEIGSCLFLFQLVGKSGGNDKMSKRVS
jgi:hypothetical protein